MNVPFKEYWGFLDQYVNLRSAEGLEKVEMYLRQKKLWILLDAQIRSAQIFLNDRLNNNSSCAADLSELVTRLEDFIQVAQCMRDNKIELKENQLSHIFEQFVKATRLVERKSLISFAHSTFFKILDQKKSTIKTTV